MRDLGTETAEVERSNALLGARAKVEKLVSVLGDLSDAEIARITHEPIEVVREVPGTLERQR